MPRAVYSINGYVLTYFKFPGCDADSQEVNRDAHFLFDCFVSGCK